MSRQGGFRTTQRQRSHSSHDAPSEPEWRPYPVSPAPEASIEDLFAEMFANDPELQAWREAERRAELFGGR